MTDGRAAVVRTVVIGLGNDLRRDDGVGPAVAGLVAQQGVPGVRVLTCPVEPVAIIDAWSGARLAVLIDAAVGGVPGRVTRCALADLAEAPPVSSHDLGVIATFRLAEALGRAPESVVVVTIDVADTSHGTGLSPAVAAALPEASRTVLDLLVPEPVVPGLVAFQRQESVDQPT